MEAGSLGPCPVSGSQWIMGTSLHLLEPVTSSSTSLSSRHLFAHHLPELGLQVGVQRLQARLEGTWRAGGSALGLSWRGAGCCPEPCVSGLSSEPPLSPQHPGSSEGGLVPAAGAGCHNEELSPAFNAAQAGGHREFPGQKSFLLKPSAPPLQCA